MRIITFLLFLIFVNCSSLKYLKSFGELHNKPKKIVEAKTYKINYNKNGITEEFAHSSIDYYDAKGRKFKNIRFKSDGTRLDADRLYYYDQYGNLIREILYKQDGSIRFEIENQYNKFGQLIVSDFTSGENKMTKEYFIDRTKKSSKFVIKNQDNTLLETVLFKYDNNWREIEALSLNDKNEQTSRIEFFYDEKGNNIQTKWYNSENNLNNIYNTTFNIENDRTKVERFHITDGKPKFVNAEKFEYQYDDKGNCVVQKLISNGKVSWITRYKYTYFR